MTAALVACTGGDSSESDEASTPDTAGDGASSPSDADVEVFQTASALELGAVEAYATVIDSGLLTTTSVVESAELFHTHHEEHARLLQSVIEDAGAEPVTEPDTSLLDALLAQLVDEASGVRLLLEAERVLDAAYRESVGGYDDASLNQVAMTVGGVEARHAAVFALASGMPAMQAASRS